MGQWGRFILSHFGEKWKSKSDFIDIDKKTYEAVAFNNAAAFTALQALIGLT